MGDIVKGIGQNVTPIEQAKNKDFLDAIENIKKEQAVSSGIGQGAGKDYERAIGEYFNALNTQKGAAEGTAPSAAQAQLQKGLDQSIAAQSALANTGPAAGNIARQKQGAQQGANLRQNAANDAARLRAEEMAIARGQYAQSALGGTSQTSGRQLGAQGQALGAAGSILGGHQTAMSLEQQRLAQQGQMGAKAAGGILSNVPVVGDLFSSDELKTDISPDGESDNFDIMDKIKSYIPGNKKKEESSSEESQPQGHKDKILGTATKLAPLALAAFSDENLKKNVHISSDIGKFLNKIDPKTFKYKNSDGIGGRTPGKHMGVIAQEVEKAPGGKSMIVDTEEGKMINTPAAVGTLMAAAAYLNQRINKMEKRR